MSNTDKSQEAIEAALVALTAISKSSVNAKRTFEPDGSTMSKESEIMIIHSISNEAVERLHDYLDSLSVE